jgi:hypothetical protein
MPLVIHPQMIPMSGDEITPRGKASGSELAQLIESFEDLMANRQHVEAAWAMYRRMIVCFIGMVSREQLKVSEDRGSRASRVSIASKFKMAAKTLMVRPCNWPCCGLVNPRSYHGFLHAAGFSWGRRAETFPAARRSPPVD